MQFSDMAETEVSFKVCCLKLMQFKYINTCKANKMAEK
jgi:hypothetical protein